MCWKVNELLRLIEVKKSFGGVVAVDGVSLSIGQGKVVGLIGPNGSGKSTLFNIISGLLRPDHGRIIFKGENISGLSPHRIFKLGLAKSFQIPNLFRTLTPLENFMVPPKNQLGENPLRAPLHNEWEEEERRNAKKAVELLKFLNLFDRGLAQSGDLSGGQMKLCEIGRGLMGTPTLILLDEPAAGVAPALAKEIMDMILKLREELGTSFFIIEHRLDVFLDKLDLVYVMHLGRVIFEGQQSDLATSEIVKEVYLGRD